MTSSTDRERDAILRRRSHEAEDRLDRDRRDNRPTDAIKRAGPLDKALPHSNSRVVRPGD